MNRREANKKTANTVRPDKTKWQVWQIYLYIKTLAEYGCVKMNYPSHPWGCCTITLFAMLLKCSFGLVKQDDVSVYLSKEWMNTNAIACGK